LIGLLPLPPKPRTKLTKPSFTAKNDSQREFIALAERHSYVFQVGPAGAGKTYAAVALAVSMHKAKAVHKIVICRPAVGAGEQLGFVPGGLPEKLAPWMHPIYDALEKAGGETYRNASFVDLRSFEHMRGATFEDAIVVVDEAQNATFEQLQMVMTRLGEGSKMFIQGDPAQCDLPGWARGGLELILKLLENNDEFPVVHYRDSDNLRHPLVGELTRIFSRYRASLS